MSNKVFSRYKALADKAGIKRNTIESMKWFIDKVRSRPIDPQRVREGFKKTRLKPGMMITYGYSPKTYDKLPYWDENPLIIILSFTENGWYGCNLHYLPPSLRAVLIYEINRGKKSLAEIAFALEKNKYTKPCLKRYLANYVTTRTVTIPKGEWDIAIALPFETFKGSNNRNVWKESRNKI